MVGRNKKAFALKHKIKVETTGTTPGSVTGSYWVLTNLNTDVYGCQQLRNILGIYPEEDARNNAAIADIVTVNSITELCRMGVVGELSCTIQAVDQTVYFPLLGPIQKTSFIYDLSKSVKDVARDLLAISISVGAAAIPYKVVPGTLRVKKQKSRTPHLG